MLVFVACISMFTACQVVRKAQAEPVVLLDDGSLLVTFLVPNPSAPRAVVVGYHNLLDQAILVPRWVRVRDYCNRVTVRAGFRCLDEEQFIPSNPAEVSVAPFLEMDKQRWVILPAKQSYYLMLGLQVYDTVTVANRITQSSQQLRYGRVHGIPDATHLRDSVSSYLGNSCVSYLHSDFPYRVDGKLPALLLYYGLDLSSFDLSSFNEKYGLMDYAKQKYLPYMSISREDFPFYQSHEHLLGRRP
jgi:hypothetical protein